MREKVKKKIKKKSWPVPLTPLNATNQQKKKEAPPHNNK
jgi:hypothetical protein